MVCASRYVRAYVRSQVRDRVPGQVRGGVHEIGQIFGQAFVHYAATVHARAPSPAQATVLTPELSSLRLCAEWTKVAVKFSTMVTNINVDTGGSNDRSANRILYWSIFKSSCKISFMTQIRHRRWSTFLVHCAGRNST